ncbi:unnamed protein product [Sphagnum balticum]
MRGHTTVVFGSYLHVFGGYSKPATNIDGTERLNDLWSIDLDNPTYCEWALNKTDRGPLNRQKHSCVVLEDGKVVVYGGFDGDKWLKDLHTLDLSYYELHRLEQFAGTADLPLALRVAQGTQGEERRASRFLLSRFWREAKDAGTG